MNKSTSAKTWQTAVDEKLAAAARDLGSIQATAGQHSGALTARYLETLDTRELAVYRERLNAVSEAEASVPLPTAAEDRRVGYKVLKLTGTPEQITQALELLELAGVSCEELEDGMPRPMPELTTPDFDSLVACDIETSGT